MSFFPSSFDILPIVWLCASLLMLSLWILQWFHQNAVIADLGFCVLFGITSLVYAAVLPGDILRKGLLGMMGTVYALRLSWHLFVHRIYGKLEDARYQALRKRMGRWSQWGFFAYFQGQALALVIFSIPLLILMVNPNPPFSIWEILGMILWAGAMVGETLADSQLRQFRENPTHVGKTCRQGLWRYSRHPNYFFEGLLWISYVIMGIGIPNSGFTLIGPLLMIGALLKISGIPFSEAQALATRGEDYREYQRTTSAFIPWFPK